MANDDQEDLQLQGKIPVLTPAESTAKRLKAYSHAFINDVINNRDLNSPLFSQMDECYAGYIDHIATTKGIDEWKKLLLYLFTTYPEYFTEILNCTAEVDETNGKATVWLTMKQGGFPGGVALETICQITWKRRRSGWKCQSYTGLDWGGIAPSWALGQMSCEGS